MCMIVIFDVFDVSLMYNTECNSVQMFVHRYSPHPLYFNNVMLFLEYMDLYLELHYFLYKYSFSVLVQLVFLFFWLIHSVAVAICLPVVVLQLSN